MGGTWPKITKADDPELIKWENLGVTKRCRYLETFRTNVTAFMLVLLTFYAVMYLTKKKVETAGELEDEHSHWTSSVC